jgi:hypothetical protein
MIMCRGAGRRCAARWIFAHDIGDVLKSSGSVEGAIQSCMQFRGGGNTVKGSRSGISPPVLDGKKPDLQ